MRRCGQAVGAVVGPTAGGLDKLAGRNQSGVIRHGDEVALATGFEPQDAKAIVRIMERHTFNEAGEVLGRGS